MILIGSDVPSVHFFVSVEDSVVPPTNSFAQMPVLKYLEAQATSLLSSNFWDTKSVAS
jgi:hypothetical protein